MFLFDSLSRSDATLRLGQKQVRGRHQVPGEGAAELQLGPEVNGGQRGPQDVIGSGTNAIQLLSPVKKMQL